MAAETAPAGDRDGDPSAGRLPGAARRPSATSVDVARLAGVSRSTVSHILNGQTGRFAEETVERVRDAAGELGYVPSAAGRTLVRGRSDLVVLAVPNTTLTNVQDIIEAIAVDLDDLGYSMVVHFDRGGPSGENLRRLQDVVDTLRPAGLVDLGSLSVEEIDILDRQGCPMLSPRTPRGGQADEGNLEIARGQARHLIDRGYRSLGYAGLVDRRDDPFGRMRAVVVAEVCADAGLPAPAVFGVPLEPVGAQQAVAALLAEHRAPVGVACSNDEVALAVTFAALALSLAVPGRLGVVGVGGSRVGQLVSPRLSTVTFDIRASVSGIRRGIAGARRGESRMTPELPAGVFTVLQGETS